MYETAFHLLLKWADHRRACYKRQRNVRGRHGTCDRCGQVCELVTFDARQYGTVIGRGVIPLRQYHVIDRCSVCGHHQWMNLEKWEAASARGIRDALEACRKQPISLETARRAVDTLRYYGATQELGELAERLIPQTRDSRFLCWLAGHCQECGMIDRAQTSLRRAIELDPNDHDLQVKLADMMISQSRPDEAWLIIEQAIEEEWGGAISVAMRAAACYQDHGMHQESAQILDYCVVRIPDCEARTDYQRLRQGCTDADGDS